MELFDECDFKSYYFGDVTLNEAREVLINEDPGVFLLRDSSRGGLVLCVKEKHDVSQYPIHMTGSGNEKKFYIREDCPFSDLPTLLSFYKMNLFESASLVRPICKEKVEFAEKRTRQRNAVRHEVMSEYMSTDSSQGLTTGVRMSAPPSVNRGEKCASANSGGPVYARVIRARHPSPYFENDLDLNVGDIILVTKRRGGVGEGVLDGVTGTFPLANVELIDR